MTGYEVDETTTPRLHSVLLDEIPATDVAPGIRRRALPGVAVAARVFDFEPGTRWPEVDQHHRDEMIYVASGELIEGEDRYPAGSYLHYEPGTSHRPRTEVGVRILVFSRPEI